MTCFVQTDFYGRGTRYTKALLGLVNLQKIKMSGKKSPSFIKVSQD
jgi:hypothetical protein